MMNWWNVLKVSYDSDLRTIKKAYAKLLKIYNPEDDAEGYQNLREAYDAAVKYAKKNQEFINDNLDKNIINEVKINKNEENKSESYSNEQIIFKLNLDINEIYHERQDTKIDLNEQIKQFLNRLNEIYNDMYLRTDLAAWEDLLNSDVIWNVNGFPIIEDKIFNFLSKNKYLPAEIWTKLNDNFTWSKNEIKLCNKHSALIVDEFLKNLKVPNKLKYDYIRSINPEIADEYLYERQRAEEALKDKKYAKAYKHLKNANSLFSHDAELLRLMGDYNYELNDIEKALQLYKSAFEINNYDLGSALRIAIILVTYKSFSEAISYLKVYLSYNNNDKLALNHIAYCYYYNDDLIMARENFEKLLYIDRNNKTIKKYLKNIEAILKGKHVIKIRFNKDNFMVEEIVKKEITTKKISNKKSKIISTIIKYVISCIIICIVSGLNYIYSVNVDNSNSQNKKKCEDNNKENKIDIKKQILDSKMKIYMAENLSNVKPIEYYKMSEPFENRIIFSDSELDEKGLRDKVLSQIYIGTSESGKYLYIFANPKLSDKTIDKKGKYEINGDMCYIDKEIGDRIKEEYASDYSGYDFIDNGFIDSSSAASTKT
ncbi:hypothetical protein psyc5s11_18210 [Clostridium gelidum]|uniref:J domain-containing protein n=1 Tax=Clostridium gelidum TaxID=704125 RepID=A0ABN6IUM6_9CLOT|nr:J domain-containing protein [Clostridium gelidum]BCZ45754.1 hypothetical protein psyc5s11_18210 [Clostridium gelidum]